MKKNFWGVPSLPLYKLGGAVMSSKSCRSISEVVSCKADRTSWSLSDSSKELIFAEEINTGVPIFLVSQVVEVSRASCSSYSLCFRYCLMIFYAAIWSQWLVWTTWSMSITIVSRKLTDFYCRQNYPIKTIKTINTIYKARLPLVAEMQDGIKHTAFADKRWYAMEWMHQASADQNHATAKNLMGSLPE